VSDDGLAHLETLQMLHELKLRGNKGITDASVRTLIKHLPAIRKLDLYSTSVSISFKLQLARLHPINT